MSCPCDKLIHPPLLNIDAGLERIPRQIAGFADFRRAMLAELPQHAALGDWRARNEDDLGVMLLEMWAYVCDVLSFYDEVIAHEGYLRTARRRPSLRKLVGLLGHTPRPAVAASVYLAAIAEGRKPVSLPAGTAFRSESFDGQPPQVFELEAAATIHLRNNQWRLGPQPPATLGEAARDGATGRDQLLLEPDSVDLTVGDPILVRVAGADGSGRVATVRKVAPYRGGDGNTYTKVTFDTALGLKDATEPAAIRLSRPAQTAGLWLDESSSDMGNVRFPEIDNAELELSGRLATPRLRATSLTMGAPVSGPGLEAGFTRRLSFDPTLRFLWRLDLDGLHKQIRPDQRILVSRQGNFRVFTVDSVKQEDMPVSQGQITVTGENDNFTVNPPPVKIPVTRLILNEPLSIPRDGAVTVHYSLVDAGTVTAEARTALDGGGAPTLTTPGGGLAEPPPDKHVPDRLLLQDRNDEGLLIEENFEFRDRRLDLGDRNFKPALETPVAVFGNVLRASRGETVPREVLGSGDASVAGQSFKLKKKPLTYLRAPGGSGGAEVRSTLSVWVDGIRWREVNSFFGTRPDERVYRVRQNDQGESTVHFRGRLSTGVDNVVARYRFGAGAAEPPAGAIHQLAKPVKGLTGVTNPLSAFGGADAEGPRQLRNAAPRSALLLGRAVSLADFEAKAALETGVRAVRVEWRWDEKRQRPVVQVWYIGKPGIEGDLRKSLRSSADPTVDIVVERARPRRLRLVLTLEIDARYRDDEVLAAVRDTLTNADSGILAPENVGIDRPLFRSRIFEQALSVEGAVAVTALSYDIDPFTENRLFTKSAIEPHVFQGRRIKDDESRQADFSKYPYPATASSIRNVERFIKTSENETRGRYFDLEEDELVLNAREDEHG